MADPATGRQLFNTLRPMGSQLPDLLVRDQLVQAAQSRQPVISGIVERGSVTGKPLVSVWVPVVRRDAVPYVVAAVFDVNSLKRLLLADNIPGSWTGSLYDQTGLLIVSTRDAETPTAADPSAAVRSALASGKAEGIYSSTKAGQIETVTPYYRSPLSGWSIHYAVPSDEIEGPLLRSGLITFGTGGLSALLAPL